MLARPANPSKEDYDFGGWFVDNLHGLMFDFVATPITGARTLYARWIARQAGQFNVIFYHHSGSDYRRVNAGGNVHPPSAPQRDGHDFYGWFTAPSGGYPFNYSTDSINAHTRIYAQWNIQTRNLTFDLQSGAGGPYPLTVTLDWNSLATRPAVNPTKDNHDFVDWYTQGAGGEPFNFATTRITIATTIYARWAIHEFDVVFHFMTGEIPHSYTTTVEWNNLVTRPYPDPARDGFRFINWFTEAVDGTIFDFDNTRITATTNLFGRWTPLHTATFHLHGGAMSSPISIQVAEIEAVPEPYPAPTKEHYTFAGWFTEQAGGDPFIFSAPIMGNTDIHAQWTPE
jgi:uncharacterized repeat protein (TIGR02543 family)